MSEKSRLMSGKWWNDPLAIVGWARPTLPRSLSSEKIGWWAEPTLRGLYALW
jgi:hypothetical protein